MLLPNHSSYLDGLNWLHVVGEIRNDSGQTLSSIYITANLFNSSGGLVDTRQGRVLLDHTEPGETNCFDINFFTAAGEWSYYELERPIVYASTEAAPIVAIFNDSGSFNGYAYEVIGQARNDGPTQVRYADVVNTLFTEDNTVMGCSSIWVSSTHLDPDQTSSFRTNNYGSHFANVARYHVAADGDPQ